MRVDFVALAGVEIVTATLGTAAPLGSVRVPRMAVLVWAGSCAASVRRQKLARMDLNGTFPSMPIKSEKELKDLLSRYHLEVEKRGCGFFEVNFRRATFEGCPETGIYPRSVFSFFEGKDPILAGPDIRDRELAVLP